MSEYAEFLVAQGYRYQTRKFYRAVVGPIPKGFHVHHKDGNPANTALCNLELLSLAEHRRAHRLPSPTEEEVIQHTRVYKTCGWGNHKEYARAYYAAHADKYREKHREYYRAHKDEILFRQRENRKE